MTHTAFPACVYKEATRDIIDAFEVDGRWVIVRVVADSDDEAAAIGDGWRGPEWLNGIEVTVLPAEKRRGRPPKGV